jgi:hypothetical protein
LIRNKRSASSSQPKLLHNLSMSSIKRDVKKKVPPRPESEKILVSRSSPLL